ncbi:PKD domain-containing protein [Natronoflexus pectinivorans]|uniref:Gliding motility-associated-like protein n=1 Tax=Natronoflexus pectinivorans TaxID=682526 RepID=A0A4R2GJ99_9BACT|nr:PKD domain-containing protein [Natronoflexus pectinivorans]TCO08022.1 gliding motility-associated-like protein [Natronoflexus pectinivorans]
MVVKRLAGLLFWVFLFLSGIEVKAQQCDYISNGIDFEPGRLCAPVTANLEVYYGGLTYAGGNVSIYFDWDDGSAPQIIPATFNPGNNRWIVSTSHLYPRGGDKCTYTIQVMLVVDGTLCTSSIQTQIVTVWDTDDENGGEMQINPEVFPICVGNDGTVTFMDASQWNCVPPIENDVKNERRRWIQWVYGTGGTNISSAAVDGTVRTYPFEGPVEVTPQPIEAPTPPMNQSMEIYIPDYFEVGDFFEVTIRNWNQCNPYDQGFDPVETTAIALIVDLPDGSVGAIGPFCDNDPRVLLHPATTGGTWSGPGMINPNSRWFYPSEAGPGLHTIEYFVTDDNGCSASGDVQIEVRESPVIDLIAGEAFYLCPGLEQYLDIEITGGTPPLNISWTGDTDPLSSTTIADPIFFTTDVGVFNLFVTVADEHNCGATESIVIEIEPVEIEFNPPVVEACQGAPLALNPITTGGSRVYVLHEWEGDHIDLLSDTDVSDPEFLSTETGVFEFLYRVTDDRGCSSEAIITVIVKEQPFVSAGDDDDVCELVYELGGSVEPANASGLWSLISGDGDAAFADATDAQTSVTVTESGTYEFRWLADLDGCISADVVTITFSDVPSPGIMDDVSVCGTETILEAIPDDGTGSWSLQSGAGGVTFDDENLPESGVLVSEPGIYRFRWTETTSANCGGFAEVEVEFLPQAVALVDPLPDRGCSPYQVTFSNQSSGADEYHWELGGGAVSSEAEPSFIYENLSGDVRVYNVTLTASNLYNCNDSYSFPIEVAPSPRARASASPNAGCAPLEVQFVNTSTAADSYRWVFEAGVDYSDEVSPQYLFGNDENFVMSYQVRMFAENSFGCEDSLDIPITVYPVPDLTLIATPTEGCSPLEVLFSASSGAVSYDWVFDDGNTIISGREAVHTYVNDGEEPVVFTPRVTGINAFSCEATAFAEVTIFPSPIANFSVSPVELHMPDREVSITNLTEGTDWEYHWEFGDGNVFDGVNPGQHQYGVSGNYTIVLTAYSEWCSDVFTQDVLIHPMLPVVDYGDPVSGCPPLTVEFRNNTVDAHTFLWDFGDGRMSHDAEPVHVYRTPGTYNVRLTATGHGGVSEAEDLRIVVFENPVAMFEVVPRLLYIPDDSPAFINRSIGATSYLWNFGDGATSTDFSPTHQYSGVGVYDVTLQVSNDDGCTDEYLFREALTVEQGGELAFPNAFTPNPSGSSGGKYEMGDRRNHVFYPTTQKGIIEYQLQIYTRWGELIFESNDIDIGWDGYQQNRLVPQGVYIYRVRYKTADGKMRVRAGDVTLIR